MGLIEDIAENAGCEYVSELKYHPERYPVHSVLRSIAAGSYDEKEWNEAVHYLIDENVPYCDSETCRKRLIGSFPV